MGKESDKALETELEGIFLSILNPSSREAAFKRLESKFGGETDAGEPQGRGSNVIDFPSRNVQVVKAKVVKPKIVKPKKPRKKNKGEGVLKFIEKNAEPLRVLLTLLGEVGKSAIELYARTRPGQSKPRRPRLTAPKP